MDKTKKITPFQREVFKVVSKIPLGQTRSYKWVAKKIGKPQASRAVGKALSQNPFPLLIPCHRVIHSDGNSGDYIWGKEMKREFLEIEKDIAK